MPYPLHPSPIALLRTKYGRSQPEAARRLGLSLGQQKVLEMRTCEVPPAVLDVIEVLLAPPARFTQITVWEALAELDRTGSDGGEDASRA